MQEIRTPKRKWSRLTKQQRSDIAARYEAGEVSTAIAKEYGVAKSTILSTLRKSGVEVRRQPLSREQVTEAVNLYESGLSLSQVAEKLKINQETMRLAMLARGVKMRPMTGA